MVLPGLLSSDPVGNGLTGAAIGYTATALAAAGTYLGLAYLVPYRRVRSAVHASSRYPWADGRRPANPTAVPGLAHGYLPGEARR